ncbi:MAG TPA: holo-ACP synthase [Candidatus Pelagibacter bacterium]|jgi:holo-[acyl-carrier protein] synthase|nr:holo-[acyl-carrier-protein] synthase [Pelagibacteraceae bacterium]HJN84585.1 holo-ACP synthase [Candidatus Pelagibacter bacterium]|tara:strand:- start:666 stop:1052 length:387 start_codon:yes stop_codon:yes gene_type:complete
MQILGVGVDIIENSRIKKSIKNKKFLSRVFSKIEIVNSRNISNKSNYFSKRFAAKEAFSKAVGSGFRNGLNFNDISVVKDRYGKPSIKLNTQLKNIIKKKFKTLKVDVFLSISDEKKHSIAFVILEKK